MAAALAALAPVALLSGCTAAPSYRGRWARTVMADGWVSGDSDGPGGSTCPLTHPVDPGSRHLRERASMCRASYSGGLRRRRSDTICCGDALILVTLAGATAQSTRPFPHGPLPVSPFASWAMADSTVSFFLGNITGMNNPAEFSAEARLGVVGLGWERNNSASNNTRL